MSITQHNPQYENLAIFNHISYCSLEEELVVPFLIIILTSCVLWSTLFLRYLSLILKCSMTRAFVFSQNVQIMRSGIVQISLCVRNESESFVWKKYIQSKWKEWLLALWQDSQIFINLKERGGKKRHKCVLQKNRPDHSWKEGKPFNQVLEIQAAGS